jgi:two-component system phosphate regulon response regulator PhoB
MANRILVIEDEVDLVQVLKYQLAKEGFDVSSAYNGTDGLRKVKEHPQPDLILLDLMLPDMSGKDICRTIKNNPDSAHIPVIMVTARGEEIDRVIGFELGADDYVVKPFSTRELILRIRAILRTTETATRTDVKSIGAITLDPEAHQAWYNDQLLDLTLLEFKVLTTLMSAPGRVFSRAKLLDLVWDNPLSVTERTVDSVVKRMRIKMDAGANLLETVRGVGYRFKGNSD